MRIFKNSYQNNLRVEFMTGQQGYIANWLSMGWVKNVLVNLQIGNAAQLFDTVNISWNTNRSQAYT